MMRGFASFLLARTARERSLLALLLLLAVPLAVTALVFLPLQDQRKTQEGQLSEARALMTWLTDQARSYVPPSNASAPEEASEAPPLQSAADLETSLIEAGLRQEVNRFSLQDQSSDGARRNKIALQLESAGFEPVMEWLSGLAERGVTIQSLRIEAKPDSPGRAGFDLLLETGG